MPDQDASRQIVIASNRGPISFVRDEDDGELVPTRGSGGLVTALTGALQASGGLWIASAMTDEDREQAGRGRLAVSLDDASYDVRYLAFDEEEYDGFYNGISNTILWFLHHYLWDLPRTPRFDEGAERAWAAYVRVNEAFAGALHEEGRGSSDQTAYLVQDYHLSLVPAMLRERQPDARIAHFSHIPFAGPSYFHILPSEMRQQVLAGLLGADVVGFHAERWAENFLLACRTLPGARVDLRRRRVRWKGRQVAVRVYPISIDVETLEHDAREADVGRLRRELIGKLDGRKLLLRVDRAELSKNILRGFQAFGIFLQRYPNWQGKVSFLAQLNPSREDVPGYGEYIEDCVAAADGINERFGTADWQPVEVMLKDDFPHTLAAYRLYDVLLVNPVFDGMNLVAKEGPVLNRNDGVLVLSENAGAFFELGDNAVVVNPFDLVATAEAIRIGLEMDPAERSRRAKALRRAVRRNRLARWVQAQLRDLDRATSRG